MYLPIIKGLIGAITMIGIWIHLENNWMKCNYTLCITWWLFFGEIYFEKLPFHCKLANISQSVHIYERYSWLATFLKIMLVIFGYFSESCNIGQIVLWNIFLALISTKKSRFGRSRFHFVGTFLVIFFCSSSNSPTYDYLKRERDGGSVGTKIQRWTAWRRSLFLAKNHSLTFCLGGSSAEAIAEKELK